MFQLDTGVGAKSRDILSLMTIYNSQNQSGATTHEMQAINNDSGGAVFYKRGTQWELAGIINAQVVYEGSASLYRDLRQRDDHGRFIALQSKLSQKH